MKRLIMLAIALIMVTAGYLIEPPHAMAENVNGQHFVKGKIEALESCYSNATKVSSICLGVVKSNGVKRAGKLMGDLQIGRVVYLECRTHNGFTECSNEWTTSIGENYLRGGEIAR